MGLFNQLTRLRNVAIYGVPKREGIGGVVGQATWSATGGFISSLIVRGCVKNVVRNSGGFFGVTMWPPQPWYLPIGVCSDDAVTMRTSYVGGTYAQVLPTSFVIVMVSNNSTGVDASFCGVTIFTM